MNTAIVRITTSSGRVLCPLACVSSDTPPRRSRVRLRRGLHGTREPGTKSGRRWTWSSHERCSRRWRRTRAPTACSPRPQARAMGPDTRRVLPRRYAGPRRMIDIYAAEIDMDPAEVRRRNLARSEHMPFTSATGAFYDEADYSGDLERPVAAQLCTWSGRAHYRLRVSRPRRRPERSWSGRSSPRPHYLKLLPHTSSAPSRHDSHRIRSFACCVEYLSR